MLKIGSNEILILLSMHFMNKVEKTKECKLKAIIETTFEYKYYSVCNYETWENELIKTDRLMERKEYNYFHKDIYSSVACMVKKDILKKVKHGYYELTEKGQKAVNERIMKNKQLQEMLLYAI